MRKVRINENYKFAHVSRVKQVPGVTLFNP